MVDVGIERNRFPAVEVESAAVVRKEQEGDEWFRGSAFAAEDESGVFP